MFLYGELNKNAPTKVLTFMKVSISHQVFIHCNLFWYPVSLVVDEEPFVLIYTLFVAFMKHLWAL